MINLSKTCSNFLTPEHAKHLTNDTSQIEQWATKWRNLINFCRKRGWHMHIKHRSIHCRRQIEILRIKSEKGMNMLCNDDKRTWNNIYRDVNYSNILQEIQIQTTTITKTTTTMEIAFRVQLHCIYGLQICFCSK